MINIKLFLKFSRKNSIKIIMKALAFRLFFILHEKRVHDIFVLFFCLKNRWQTEHVTRNILWHNWVYYKVKNKIFL